LPKGPLSLRAATFSGLFLAPQWVGFYGMAFGILSTMLLTCEMLSVRTMFTGPSTITFMPTFSEPHGARHLYRALPHEGAGLAGPGASYNGGAGTVDSRPGS